MPHHAARLNFPGEIVALSAFALVEDFGLAEDASFAPWVLAFAADQPTLDAAFAEAWAKLQAACARPVHRRCTACARPVHGVCTTCALPVYCLCTVHAVHAHCPRLMDAGAGVQRLGATPRGAPVGRAGLPAAHRVARAAATRCAAW